MFSKLFTTFFILSAMSLVLGKVLNCGNHNQNYEGSPDANWNSGSYGEVARTGGKATKSLCVIDYPGDQGGKKCKLIFENPSSTRGSKRAQVFSLGSAEISSATWNANHGAHQDQHLATFQFTSSARADTIEFGTFDCPSGPVKKGYAIVPTWDEDYISWTAPGGGLKVEY